jgi:hypothetical protein
MGVFIFNTMTLDQKIDCILIKHTDSIEGYIHEDEYDDLLEDIKKLIENEVESLKCMIQD